MIQFKNSNEEFNIQMQDNINQLEEIKDLYNKKIDLYSKCLTNMNTLLEKYEIDDKEYLISLYSKTKNSFQELVEQIETIEKCRDLINLIKYKYDRNIDCKDNINNYNEGFKNIKNNYFNSSIYEENIMLNYIETQISYLSSNGHELELDKKEKTKDNGTLLISEIQNKVILPYTGKEVDEMFEKGNGKYNNVEEVIEENFVRPLSDYKDLYRARTRETYKLLTERENYSKFEATDIVMELFGKRYLHPAIISACRCLDELDVYLDCLDKNELDDFRIFKIKYEIYPTLVKENRPFVRLNILQKIIEFFKKNFSKKRSKGMRYS